VSARSIRERVIQTAAEIVIVAFRLSLSMMSAAPNRLHPMLLRTE
jgi:hypothetical protein